ncbi:glycosyltransferase family 4 protein [Vibrio cholerae]|nr:glycosyltransferase family 4 protein [Vibrio cholerae]EIV0336578.1 glycosyltransferase family 4 protein [Vibrio cholerae]TQQ55120.1 glycosyltransferase family 4 protein [Vibrio cholerae]TXX54876.1 glycosyltransferase family 4 protein [Vibrio cholerae]BCN17886.1 putative glycosyltransferase [Vibrio cholerae]GIB87031.1 glycosyl transferase family 1 [Vibrio cholerae]
MIAGYPDSLLNFRGPLLNALLAAGLDVHVAAPDLPVSSEVRQRLEALGVQVHEVRLNRTGMNPLSDLGSLFNLWWLMRRLKPDFSLAYTIKPVIYGNVAAWLAEVPYRFALITGLGYAFQGEAGQRSLLKRVVQNMYGFALAKVNKVFFQNPEDEALFYDQEILNSANRKTVVVNGSGIDVDSFTVVPFPETTQFLLIARLLGDKGVREYVQAATKVRKQYPNTVFGLVGWIDENPDAIDGDELQSWVDSGVVKFYGRLADVKPAIADSSVYVLPSYREGTPRTVLEAMAMGRAVITTDAPGCRETVVLGKNGFLVPVKSTDELAAAMIHFIDNPELVVAMGKESRLLAEEKYDVRKVNAHMLREMGIK